MLLKGHLIYQVLQCKFLSRCLIYLIDFVSYNLQKTNLDKAKLSLVQAKYDFVFRTKILDYYQGKSLTF